MILDPVILSRLQFVRAVARHMLLPVILLYTGWSPWVFRGKVRGDIGYRQVQAALSIMSTRMASNGKTTSPLAVF